MKPNQTKPNQTFTENSYSTSLNIKSRHSVLYTNNQALRGLEFAVFKWVRHFLSTNKFLGMDSVFRVEKVNDGSLFSGLTPFF